MATRLLTLLPGVAVAAFLAACSARTPQSGFIASRARHSLVNGAVRPVTVSVGSGARRASLSFATERPLSMPAMMVLWLRVPADPERGGRSRSRQLRRLRRRTFRRAGAFA